MHAEDLWVVVVWQRIDVGLDLFYMLVGWNLVLSTLAEPVFFVLHYVFVLVDRQNAHK